MIRQGSSLQPETMNETVLSSSLLVNKIGIYHLNQSWRHTDLSCVAFLLFCSHVFDPVVSGR